MLLRAPAPKAGVYPNSTTPARRVGTSLRLVVRALLAVSYRANMRTADEVDRVLALLGVGLTATEVACATGIPRSTVRDWGCGRGRRLSRRSECPKHDFASLAGHDYAYLLGMYLGDGCISGHRRGVWRLRVTLDAAYPNIIAECASAMSAVSSGRRVNVLRKRGARCVEVSNYWRHWPCYLPQHGPWAEAHTPDRFHRLAVGDRRSRC
jgi:hypothetical protein